jgi:hypothetical protein
MTSCFGAPLDAGPQLGPDNFDNTASDDWNHQFDGRNIMLTQLTAFDKTTREAWS